MLDLAHQVVKDGEGRDQVHRDSRQRRGECRQRQAHRPGGRQFAFGQDGDRRRRRQLGPHRRGGRQIRESLATWIASSISIGGVPITAKGMMRPDYDEAPVAQHMKGQDIVIEIDAGRKNGKPAPGRATVWTCDLTHAYIDINIGYRS